MPAGAEQPAHGLLRQVLHDAAAVARPLVARGVGAVVHRHEGDLVEPRRDAPIGGDVAARGAGAERDPQHPAAVHRHRSHQGGDVAVIRDVERDVVPGMLEVAKDVPHALLEGVGRHAPEQRGELHLVVDVDAGRAAADGVDARQVLGRPVQRIHDPVPVVLRVGLVVGIPFGLLAPDDAAVDDRRHLAVAAPEIEADAAAVEVPAELGGRRSLRRQLVRRHHLDRVTVDALADDLRVEAAGRACRENARAALRPERRARRG